MATMQEDKQALVPKLRFPEFRGSEGWARTPLNKIARPITERATQGDATNILSLSADHGIILQSDFFGKQVAGNDISRYIRIERDDFVYNDRTTKASVYGTIKRLSKYLSGIVSPIYKCFRFQGDENPVFWECYFESGFHTLELANLINEGARAGRFNISISQFLSTSVCQPEKQEQQKIADCLSSLDELISAQARKVEALKTHKKGLMQQLFPREGETQPQLRFPEFQDAGDWERLALQDVASFINEKISLDQVELENYVSTENILPDFAGITTASRLPPTSSVTCYRSGDTLVSNIRPYLKKVWTADRDGGASNDVIVIRAKHSLLPEYCSFLLKNDAFIDYAMAGAKGVKMPRGDLETIREYPSPVPPFLPEQQKIADCLDSLDEVIRAQAQKVVSLRTHKRALMQQLFPSG